MPFDAIFSGNFIEHIAHSLAFVLWPASRLAPRGRLYLEWPRPHNGLPSASQLAAHGVRVTTGRYDDDGTRRAKMPVIDDVRSVLERTGMEVVEAVEASAPASFNSSRSMRGATATWAPDDRLLVHTGWRQHLVGRPSALKVVKVARTGHRFRAWRRNFSPAERFSDDGESAATDHSRGRRQAGSGVPRRGRIGATSVTPTRAAAGWPDASHPGLKGTHFARSLT